MRFTDDPALVEAVARAVEVPIHGVGLRVLEVADLLHEKLRTGSDPARRRSKRQQDSTDVQALLEPDAGRFGRLNPAERALLDDLPD